MMARGKRASIAHKQSSNKRSKRATVASAPGLSIAKRFRSRAPVQAINQSGRQHPSELVRRPVLPQQSPPDSASPLSASLNNMVPS